jgi:PTS system nitrogen regulatory IIA component
VEQSLYPREIALDLDARGKTEVLEAVAKVLNGSCQIDAAVIFRALRRREQAGSTAVGDGLAIPHARVPGIAAPVTLFARTRSPVRFGGPDGKPVSEFFVILVPSEGATEAHLQLLGAVAELFSDVDFRARLAAAHSASAVADAFARSTGRDDDGELEALYGTS